MCKYLVTSIPVTAHRTSFTDFLKNQQLNCVILTSKGRNTQVFRRKLSIPVSEKSPVFIWILPILHVENSGLAI